MSERNAYGVLTTLTGAMAIGPLLTYGLDATGALVVDSLRITLSQFGLLASLTFLSASVTSLTLGPADGSGECWRAASIRLRRRCGVRARSTFDELRVAAGVDGGLRYRAVTE